VAGISPGIHEACPAADNQPTSGPTISPPPLAQASPL
jgi:hypothetical protein